MPDAVKGNTATGASDNDLIKGHAAVVNYYNQYRDDHAIEASAPLISRYTSAKDNREVAPPTPSPIQLSTANAIIEESGITDSNATSAETEIKTSEIDKLFPRSIADGPDSRNSHNGIKKYLNDNYQSTAREKNRRVDKTRQKASTNYRNFADSLGKQQAEINRRPMTEKVETEIHQKSKIIISAEKSEFPHVCRNSALTLALSFKKTPRRKKKMLSAKEIRRKKQTCSAKEIAGELEKPEGQVPDTTTPTTQSGKSCSDAQRNDYNTSIGSDTGNNRKRSHQNSKIVATSSRQF